MRRRFALVLPLLLCVTFGVAAQNKAAPPSQKFIVYFEEWSAALGDAAQAVIAEAADYARANPGRFARVTGFADPTGSRKANALLTDLRAQVVVDQLEQDGIPAAHIIARGRGSVQFALNSQESRRVEISFGGH